MVHIHNGVLLSQQKNAFESVLVRRMNLESIIQSEVRKRKRNIQKGGTGEFICKAAMERHREKTYGHREKGKEGEIYGDSNMETHITKCKIDSQWEFAVCLRELNQVLSINLEGWSREGDGREVSEGGDIGTPMADSC